MSNAKLAITASYTYDKLDRLIQEQDGEGRTTSIHMTFSETPRPTAYSNNSLGVYVKELWNAGMNEMAWSGWQYP